MLFVIFPLSWRFRQGSVRIFFVANNLVKNLEFELIKCTFKRVAILAVWSRYRFFIFSNSFSGWELLDWGGSEEEICCVAAVVVLVGIVVLVKASLVFQLHFVVGFVSIVAILV